MRQNLARFFKDEDGAAMVEYGLLVGLIAVVCIIGVTAVGTDIEALFCAVAGKLSPVVTAAGGVPGAACP